MEIFKSLGKIKDAKQFVSHISEGVSLEVHGTLKVKKGDLTAELDYWTRVYEAGYLENAICIDDYEINGERYSISGLKIDNIRDFRQGLKNNGLSSIADLLVIDEHEVIIKSLTTNSVIKKLYGKNVIIWQSLSLDEKKNLFLKRIEAGYTPLFHQAQCFNWVNDNVVMSVEEIKEYENTLKQ